MSQDTRTPVTGTTTDRGRRIGHDRTPQGDRPGRGARSALPNPLQALYRFLISRRTGLVLILAMALLSLVGTLLEQAPAGVRDDPQAYAEWLESVRPRYGGWTDVLSSLGMFAVFSSVWFKGVTLLLAASILACSAHRTPLLWKRAMHPRTHVSDGFFNHARFRATVALPVPPARAADQVRTALRARRFRTLPDPKGPGLGLYADRFRFAPLGTVLAHLSFVLILVGVLVSATSGLKDSVAVPVGSQVEVGHGTGLTVEAKSFSDTYHPDGSPKDYVSELVLYRDGTQVAAQTVRVNQPLRWDGYSLHQSNFGPAAVMQVKDGDTALFDSGVPLQWSSEAGTHSIGHFAVPERNLSVYVIGAASGQVDPTIGAGQMQLEVYEGDSDQPVAVEVVSQGEPATIAGLEFTFQRERQFTGLMVRRDTGAIWVWIGSALMMLGLFLVLFFRHRRVWVRVRPAGEGSEVRVASSGRRDPGFESWFRQLVTDVTDAGKPTDARRET